MDNLKIKIDLSEIDYQNPTPIKPMKKKKKLKDTNQNHDHTISKSKRRSTKKYSEKKTKSLGHSQEKPKNSNNCLSLSLPLNDNFKDLTLFTKATRHWEERLVLVPNVFTYTRDIWLKKWVLVDGGDSFNDNKNYAQLSYSKYSKPYKDSQKKYVCNQEDCGKFFFEASALKKHQGIHGERLVSILLLIINSTRVNTMIVERSF